MSNIFKFLPIVCLVTMFGAVGFVLSQVEPVKQARLQAHEESKEDDPNGPVLRKDLDAIYELIAMNNNTQFMILDTEHRIMHYIAGHDHFVQGCPECGLIEQITVYRDKLNEETIKLNDFIVANPNDATVPDKVKRINEISGELDYATQKVLRSKDRSKVLMKHLMKLDEK